MKVALVIFRLGPSHGSILQSYALYRCLRQLGHEVTVVDAQWPLPLRRWLRPTASRLVKRVLGLYHGPVFYRGDYPAVMMSRLNGFIQRGFGQDLITVHNRRDLAAAGRLDVDAYVVGSDQTWRPRYVHDVRHYFLSFVSAARPVLRIAYAPSFGTSRWEYTPALEAECRQLLQRFAAVSVREAEGVTLCREHFGVSATHVLDPSMLLTKDDYLNALIAAPQEAAPLIDAPLTAVPQGTAAFTDAPLIAAPKDAAIPSPFVGYSLIDFSPRNQEMVAQIATTLHLPSCRLNAKIDDYRSPMAERIPPAIEDWLTGIHQSRLVVADSFHATVFAILLNRPFIVLANQERGLSRLQSLLAMVGLENRLVDSPAQITPALLDEPIDWEAVNARLATRRQASIEFLINALAV